MIKRDENLGQYVERLSKEYKGGTISMLEEFGIGPAQASVNQNFMANCMIVTVERIKKLHEELVKCEEAKDFYKKAVTDFTQNA